MDIYVLYLFIDRYLLGHLYLFRIETLLLTTSMPSYYILDETST